MISLEARPEHRDPTSREYFPDRLQVIRQMSRMTAEMAARVNFQVMEFVHTGEPQGKKERVTLIDTIAARHLEDVLSTMPFTVFSVGSEGGKEKHNGKLGVPMPTVLGRFGGGNGEVWMVNDPVEGTTAASQNNPGAISVVAVAAKDGLMATPDGVHYMEKLFAPPKAAGKVSLDRSVSENLQAVCDAYDTVPEKINVVILNRPRNQHHIEEATSFGTTVKLIEAGDLVPSLLSVVPPESHAKGIHMVIGSGGWEEGVIAAVAARALDGAAEGKVWTEQGTGNTLRLDELVPGSKDQAAVIFSPITSDPWFCMDAPFVSEKEASVSTVVIDQNGMSTWAHYLTFR